jgi:hypothetical protein
MADTEQSTAFPARPGELPIDLAAGRHIKGPDVAVAYRRLLVQPGADAAAGPADAPPAGQPP